MPLELACPRYRRQRRAPRALATPRECDSTTMVAATAPEEGDVADKGRGLPQRPRPEVIKTPKPVPPGVDQGVCQAQKAGSSPNESLPHRQ